MTEPLTFTVFGVAQPQGSARAFMPRKGGRFPIVTSDNPKVRGWRQVVAEGASRALNGSGRLLDGAVGLSATFYLPRPKSLGTKTAPHVKAPDADKLARAICDALSGVLFRDDSQVIRIVVSKHYAGVGESPRAVITVADLATDRKDRVE